MADVELKFAENDSLDRVLRSPQVEAKCEEIAKKVLAQAQALAPVDTGAYKKSLHIEKIPHAHRDTYAVIAGVDYALYVEAKHGTLERAAKAGRK